MKAKEAIKLLDEGRVLVNYRDGMKIYKSGECYNLVSSSIDTSIAFKLYKAEEKNIWGNNYEIRVNTSYLVAIPEGEE